jgi:FkbM family methyltransferase
MLELIPEYIPLWPAAVIVTDKRIISFEPHMAVSKILTKNIEINDLQDRITLYNCALSVSIGSAKLFFPDPSHTLIETSVSLEESFQLSAGAIEVELRRLDDFELPSRIAVINVDIEGDEHASLAGAPNLIERDRPIIFIEVLHKARMNLLDRFLRTSEYLDFRLRPDMAIHDGGVMFDHLAWNHAFVPKERLAKFKEAYDSCGCQCYAASSSLDLSSRPNCTTTVSPYRAPFTAVQLIRPIDRTAELEGMDK